MHSEIVQHGCYPTEQHPFSQTITQASNAELALIFAFWQQQTGPANIRSLALSMIEREIRSRICLDASEVLSTAQQRRVMTFARGARDKIAAFERFQVVRGEQSNTVWIIYHERTLGERSQAHALLVDPDGAISDGVTGQLAERLAEGLRQIDIIPLFSEDGSDTYLLASFRPTLRLPQT